MAIHFVLGYFDEKKVQKIFCDIIYDFSVESWLNKTKKCIYFNLYIYYIIL